MKIVWLSDFDLRGSGYFNISAEICTRLANAGHEVKALGLGYKGQEHFFPFSIIPANMSEVTALAHNLWNMWKFDVFVVALDIPIQEQLLIMLKDRNHYEFPYVGIFPLEAEPLTFSWAISLMKMEKRFVISKFGEDALEAAGVPATHLQIGIDAGSWRPPTEDERNKVRNSMLGLNEDTFLVLTVADNQERKNLVASMNAFRRVLQTYPDSRYLIVTREQNPVGWKLMDYANEIGISDKLLLFERCLPFQQLWSLYAAADAFVLPSKAEGYGLPLMEALSVGIPCVATDCSGMREQLQDGRGILIGHEYMHRDPFGNGERHWINQELLAQALVDIKSGVYDTASMVNTAKAWVKTLTWENTAKQLEEGLKEYGKTKKI